MDIGKPTVKEMYRSVQCYHVLSSHARLAAFYKVKYIDSRYRYFKSIVGPLRKLVLTPQTLWTNRV